MPHSANHLNHHSSRDRSYRLIQISDCHLPANPATSYRGLNADAGLVAVVDEVLAWQPDGVILTGDLSEDASAASYQRLAKRMMTLGVPVCALPGNHDVPAEMQLHFPAGPYSGPFVQTAGVWRIILLNSATEGRIEGSFNATELKGLEKLLEGDAPTLLALHHQPLPVGAAWIDRYMLQQPEELLQKISRFECLRAVTWGHVHQVFEQQVGSVRYLSGPSSAVNSLPATPRFTFDEKGPACRWFELFADGHMQTGILQAK